MKPDEPTPFADIDSAPPDRAALLTRSLVELAAHPEIQRVRRLALAELRPAPGQRLLDAGSGLGEVARELAALVAPGGSVVALDRSETLTAAARRQHDGGAVEYRVGDILAVDAADGEFDGVRSERVVQHLTEPDAAVAELARVTRSGGRVCLIDTDWESLAFDGVPEPVVAALRERAYDFLGPDRRRSGRALRARLVRAGLADVSARAVAMVFDSVESAATVVPFLGRDVPIEAALFPPELREQWSAAVDAATARGEFLAVLTMWVATGTRR